MTLSETYFIGAIVLLIGLRALQVMYNYRSRRRAFEREVKILTDDD